MPAHLIFGDSFLASEALKELQTQVGPPEVIEANSHRLSGPDIESSQLRSFCDAVPFLAEHRLVVVEGLLSLFEPRQGPRGPRAPAGRAPRAGGGRASLDDWADVRGYIEREMPPTTLLVLLDGRISGRNPLLERLRPVAQAQELPTPTREGLARWIRNRVSAKGARITPGAIRILSQMIGGNLWTLDNELEKLALYSDGRAIEEADVTLLVPQSREASVFSAIDALLEGRSGAAVRLMHRLRDEGAELPYIVAMIARQLRQVTLAKELIDTGHTATSLADRLGITQDVALKRTVDQARRHSWGSLKWLYGRLIEADLAVKRGRMEPDVALELLVSEASSLSGSPARRHA